MCKFLFLVHSAVTLLPGHLDGCLLYHRQCSFILHCELLLCLVGVGILKSWCNFDVGFIWNAYCISKYVNSNVAGVGVHLTLNCLNVHCIPFVKSVLNYVLNMKLCLSHLVCI